MKYKFKFTTILLIWLLSLTSVITAKAAPMIGKNGIVAYTWNSSPDQKEAVLTTSSYTFNYGRAVSRSRLSSGVYQVTFDGLQCNRGQFTVNAYGGTAFKTCRIGSWGGKSSCEVSVYCFDNTGNPLDSQFNLLFID